MSSTQSSSRRCSQCCRGARPGRTRAPAPRLSPTLARTHARTSPGRGSRPRRRPRWRPPRRCRRACSTCSRRCSRPWPRATRASSARGSPSSVRAPGNTAERPEAAESGVQRRDARPRCQCAGRRRCLRAVGCGRPLGASWCPVRVYAPHGQGMCVDKKKASFRTHVVSACFTPLALTRLGQNTPRPLAPHPPRAGLRYDDLIDPDMDMVRR